MMSLSDRLSELQVIPMKGEYVPLAPSEISQLERRIGSPLPKDYVEFAVTYGRCRLADSGTVQLVDDSRTVPLDTFFGGQAGEPSVLKKHEEYAGAFPPGAVPIGEDPLGNLYLLWVSDPELPGSIWYADYSHGDRSAVGSGGTWRVPSYLAAESFTDLLSRTRVLEDL